MNTRVALLRGINVGGKHSLPMKELSALLEALGCRDVRTFIQSGNVVFRTERADTKALAAALRKEIGKQRGFEPEVMVLGIDELETAMHRNPFPDAENDPKSLHLGFLEATPREPDLARLETLRKPSERFQLIDRVFYMHAPEGVGRSKLAAAVERCVGVAVTDRNWRTVCELMRLARS